jgi:hypothetical protein
MATKQKNSTASPKRVSRNVSYREPIRRHPFHLLAWLLLFATILAVVLFFWSWQNHKYVAQTACSASNLSLSAGQQSGAAGTIYQNIVVTNKGKKTCTIAGYPTAFLYGSDGYVLGSAAAARPQPIPSTITLGFNESAHTVLGYPQAGNFDPGICSETSTKLVVYVPGSVASLEVPLAVNWCPGFSSTAMQAGQ